MKIVFSRIKVRSQFLRNYETVTHLRVLRVHCLEVERILKSDVKTFLFVTKTNNQ